MSCRGKATSRLRVIANGSRCTATGSRAMLLPMGWRDINMNRRKPPLRLAAIPMEEGQDLTDAVLRKASADAFAALEAQGIEAGLEEHDWLRHFAAGYVMGFARHQALRHGIDADTDEAREALREALRRRVPQVLVEPLRAIRFVPRDESGGVKRASFRAEPPLADAGYLVGHLESLCASRRLLTAAARLSVPTANVDRFLTDCDTAADRLQTHQPTASLRFDDHERDVLRRAFAG